MLSRQFLEQEKMRKGMVLRLSICRRFDSYGDNLEVIESLLAELKKSFEVNIFGDIRFFLRIEVEKNK